MNNSGPNDEKVDFFFPGNQKQKKISSGATCGKLARFYLFILAGAGNCPSLSVRLFFTGQNLKIKQEKNPTKSLLKY